MCICSDTVWVVMEDAGAVAVLAVPLRRGLTMGLVAYEHTGQALSGCD